jgi:hypothetical protein
MDTPIFARIPLSIEGHPFDALSAGERRLLARIESQTLARIAACAHYADVRRRNVVPGHDALMEDRGDSAGCRLAASAQDFAGFVLERGPWAVRVFLDWMGVAAADLGPPPTEHAVDELIVLLHGLDALLIMEAAADVEAFFAMSGCRAHREGIERTLLARYRGRFLASPQRDPRFARRLAALTTRAQLARIEAEIR